MLNSLSVSFESRESDTNFVVASLSIGSVSLSLLEHQEQAAGGELELREVEEEAVEDEEAESISVPVHGLGTVSVRSAPVSARYDAAQAIWCMYRTAKARVSLSQYYDVWCVR